MKFLFFILCFSTPLCVSSALSSHGLTLLSLLKHWTFVPPSINSSWKASDSSPCSWVGIQCDHHSNVVSLNLTASGINGTLGPEIGNLNYLHTLVLLSNDFSGIIPLELGNCSMLEYIDLSDNYFSGQIPYTLKNLLRLKHIYMFDNNLSGVIPQSLGINSSLERLDLMNNKFTGNIPPNLCFGKQLRVLNLGEIPLEIGKMKKLLSLDVSLNNLTGSVYVLNELSSLIEVNISYNSFAGPVPARLMQYLNSSMSSFLGNPGLCIDCSLSKGLSCAEIETLKLCGHHKSTNKNGLSIVKIVMIELGCSIFLYFILPGLVYKYVKYRSKQREMEEEAELSTAIDRMVHGIVGDEPSSSLVKEVMKATGNLNDKHIIGRGAHGVVYKASIDPRSGHVVAVKKVVFRRNKKRSLSMLREIETVRKIKHRNLVRFEGFWMGKDYGLIFYPYMVNGSLHDVLHERNQLPTLGWNIRYKIAVGIANGLAYLHHDCDPPIVHQDIKPKNILLDSEMEAHISDFGVAMLLNPSSSSPTQKRSTYIALGTVGYIAPVQSGVSDVYSYGVVLLELITGKKVLDPSFMEKMTLVGWVRSMWMHTRSIENIVDSRLARELSDGNVVEQVTRVLRIALQCSEKDPRKRPTMRRVIKLL
ncbi:receptor-like protein kinase [Senna tora]|uniref:non-specific serine/threonine protein kinase n=1 Tax=Senna tora TaxID=362788 RepID=A0A834XDR5_9FABA|nr:receptor-like protein kinase [Senna tora]